MRQKKCWESLAANKIPHSYYKEIQNTARG